MSHFHYLQVNIGRNVGSTPMSDYEWLSFGAEVCNAFGLLLDAMNQWHPSEEDYQTLSRCLEIHEGRGNWGGRGTPDEESTHYSVLLNISDVPGPEMARLITWFRRELRAIGGTYGQEAIGFITGSRLIKIPAEERS